MRQTANERVLGIFEYRLLSMLLEPHPGESYGATLQKMVEAELSITYNEGAVQTALNRLEKKGFVTSRWSDPVPTRGGRRRRLFKIEAPGRDAVARTQATYRTPAASA